INVILALVNDIQQGNDLLLSSLLVQQFERILSDKELDPALISKMLTIPGENYLAAQMDTPDVDAIHEAREFIKRQLALALKAQFNAVYERLSVQRQYQFTAADMAQRSLRNLCLSYLIATGDPMQLQRCLRQMKIADNMTD